MKKILLLATGIILGMFMYRIYQGILIDRYEKNIIYKTIFEPDIPDYIGYLGDDGQLNYYVVSSGYTQMNSYVNVREETIPLGYDFSKEKHLSLELGPQFIRGSKTFIVMSGERYLLDIPVVYSTRQFDVFNHKGAPIQICILGIKEKKLSHNEYVPLTLHGETACKVIEESEKLSFNGLENSGIGDNDTIRLVIVASISPTEITVSDSMQVVEKY